jgi:Lactonase, 7-bladed beta-propeller
MSLPRQVRDRGISPFIRTSAGRTLSTSWTAPSLPTDSNRVARGWRRSRRFRPYQKASPRRTPGSEILVHPSGKFVYVSNRGHDSVGVFETDAADGTNAAAARLVSHAGQDAASNGAGSNRSFSVCGQSGQRLDRGVPRRANKRRADTHWTSHCDGLAIVNRFSSIRRVRNRAVWASSTQVASALSATP